MSHPTATRSELLARRAQTDLATAGRDLLQDKRTALIREFGTLGAEALDRVEKLERVAVRARRTLDDAVARHGLPQVLSASWAAGSRVEVELDHRVVAGVEVARLTHGPVGRPRTERGYPLAVVPTEVDDVAARYEDLLQAVLDVAAVELNLRRLAREIERTTRRMNAIDQVVLPRIQAERDWIAQVLTEREREEQSRLRRARNRRAARSRTAVPRPVESEAS